MLKRNNYIYMKTSVQETIRLAIKNSLHKIDETIDLKWINKHLVDPTNIKLCTDLNNKIYREFWLVTDHMGEDDSAYRVVFDDQNNVFGLETTLDNGINWYMGDYGDFNEAVKHM